MAVTLPTGWLRDVPGARVYSDGGALMDNQLSIQMPKALVPVRRYARVHAAWMGGGRSSGSILLSVSHEEPFQTPVPGRNAWQSSSQFAVEGKRIHLRTLDRRWDRVVGEPSAVEALRRAVRITPTAVLVRVTPEGFQLMVPVHGTSLAGLGERLCGSNDPIHAVRAHRNHGNGCRPARRGEEMACDAPVATPVGRNLHAELANEFDWSWRPATYPHFHHGGTARGRCRQFTQQHFHIEAKETETMKTIDKTTSADLPFGLIAGETIVRAVFSDHASSDYAYFAGGLELAEGDYVVVASPYGDGGAVYDEECGGFLKVVRIVSTDLNLEGIKKAAKWVVSKVDVTEYQARRERIEQIKVLDEQIRQAESQARKLLEMERLRELSPELNDLVARRMALTGIAEPKDEPKAD